MTEPHELSALSILSQLRGADSPESVSEAGLEALLDLGPSLGSLDDDDVRQRVLEALVDAVAAERGFVVAGPREDGEDWRVLASRTFEGEEVLNPGDKIIRPLLEPCREQDRGFLTLDLENEPMYPSLARQRQPRTRSVLVVPFPGSDTAIYLDHRFQPLEISDNRFCEFAWLFTLLVAGESKRAWEQVHTELQSELQTLRKQARGRLGAPAARSGPVELSGDDPRGFRGDFSDIVGRHPDILEILALIEKIAPTQAPVLINGESGTGKELVAMAIHKNSPRVDTPFVTENCAALAETLLEAELFGTMKGAYTGAHADRPGLFEQAHGGTLFLDEIGDTSPGLQKKLLRVLQEGTIRRLGGQELIRVDVRIISATNKDLFQEVQAGRFREDLFYRLNVINIVLPPLRDRREDIPLLIQHFLDHLNDEEAETKEATNGLISTMMVYNWPGNVRELQNEIRRVFALGGQYLRVEDLSPRITAGPTNPESALSLDAVLELGSLKDATEAWERQVLMASLKRFGGNKAKVCARLQIPKTTLYTKLRRYGLLQHDE